VPVTFLRPAWFLENIAWDIASAREGFMASYLQPIDRGVRWSGSTISATSRLIGERWESHRVVELESRARISPAELGEILASLLGHGVDVHAVPRESWEVLFTEGGILNPYPRIRMLDGFNEARSISRSAKRDCERETRLQRQWYAHCLEKAVL